MELNDRQLDILRHMLGINDRWAREPKPYRNYFAAGPGDEELEELERIGAVRLIGKRWDLLYYETTAAGRVAAMASHKKIRMKKPQRVYSRYLSVSDCCSDLTFKEFLTKPEYAEIRRNA